MNERILQANLSNSGGAFSLIYCVQKKINEKGIVFDYFSQNHFKKNNIYNELIDMKSIITDEISCNNRLTKQINTYKTLRKYLKEHHYKYIHIHADTAWKAYIYLLAAKKEKIENIIVHSHSTGINGKYKIINYILHTICKKYINKYAAIKCACTPEAGKWMFGKSNEIIYVDNGIDINKFKFSEKNRINIRKRLGIKESDIVIGTVGDFSTAKNPWFLMKLLLKLSENKYKFILIGDGPNRRIFESKIKNKIGEEKMKSKFYFSGAVSDPEKYLSAMDIFVLPSKFEGLPMSALEAQCNGLFVFVSNSVTKSVCHSKLCKRIPLSLEIWSNELKKIKNTSYRDKAKQYINLSDISVDKTSIEIMRLYGLYDEYKEIKVL